MRLILLAMGLLLTTEALAQRAPAAPTPLTTAQLDATEALISAKADELTTGCARLGDLICLPAVALRKELSAFRAGRAGQVPADWSAISLQADPEWATYERLRAKFRAP